MFYVLYILYTILYILGEHTAPSLCMNNVFCLLLFLSVIWWAGRKKVHRWGSKVCAPSLSPSTQAHGSAVHKIYLNASDSLSF